MEVTWSSAKCKGVIAFLLLACSAAGQVEDGPLINGNFETPSSGGFSSGDGFSDGPTVIPSWRANGTVELVESGQKQGGMILIVPQGRHALKVEKGSIYSITFSAAHTCAQLESLNVSVPAASQTMDLQTLYNVQGWDSYAWAFQAEEYDVRIVFTNTGMEDDPTCGTIIDDIAIKKLFSPEKSKGKNASLGILLPTNLDEETSSLPSWIVESNRAVGYIDTYHFTVPQGKRAIELLSGKEGTIFQMVETKPNKPYRLTFLTCVAFYNIYYNTRSDDRSSLCGPVVDNVRVELSGSSRIKVLGFGFMFWLLALVLV
ncbi:unnamed protein product [Withania somnifera]